MMTLFSTKINLIKKKILFIIFLFSIIVSHYSTAYIFFFVMLGTYLGIALLSKKYHSNKSINFITISLFFVSIFSWYSQITGVAFRLGVAFIVNTLNSFYNFFLIDSRGSDVPALIGKDITSKGIPYQIQFISTWLTFLLIGIGIFTLVKRIKEMSFSELSSNKPDFLREKFDVEYSLISLICTGLLILMVALPYLSIGYGITRLYGFTVVVLSIFFVIGGMVNFTNNQN